MSHGFRNFEIAAGACEGTHWGPPFHDGDMYKWLEGVASIYAVTKDPKLDALMDRFIDHVVRAQRADGYIQETDYPWDGTVRLTVEEAPRRKAFALHLRIPEWCNQTTLTVNGTPVQTSLKTNTYAEVNRQWKKGDVVELVMDMPAVLIEANPLAEEIRNQVVVKRGPLVYCLESMDIADGEKIDNILIPADIHLTPERTMIEGSPIVALRGKARLAASPSWEGALYRPIAKAERTVGIRLVPYYAWGNRGKGEMTVWMSLTK